MEKSFQADGDQVLRWANENKKLATYPIKVAMWAFGIWQIKCLSNRKWVVEFFSLVSSVLLTNSLTSLVAGKNSPPNRMLLCKAKQAEYEILKWMLGVDCWLMKYRTKTQWIPLIFCIALLLLQYFISLCPTGHN